MGYLHFIDKNNLGLSDNYTKIRPIIKHSLPLKNMSHGKAMLKYIGNHSYKQTIHKTTI